MLEVLAWSIPVDCEQFHTQQTEWRLHFQHHDGRIDTGDLPPAL